MAKDEEYYKIHPLILDLKSKSGLKRQNARETLVSIGAPAVSYLAELIDRPSATLRWEIVKTLGQIADPDSASFFITSLYDKDEEVRWLAAEGLIALGATARVPLLRGMVKNSKSAWLRRGAHHYFRAMREIERSSRYDKLLSALESEDPKLSTPIAAEKLLKAIEV